MVSHYAVLIITYIFFPSYHCNLQNSFPPHSANPIRALRETRSAYSHIFPNRQSQDLLRKPEYPPEIHSGSFRSLSHATLKKDQKSKVADPRDPLLNVAVPPLSPIHCCGYPEEPYLLLPGARCGNPLWGSLGSRRGNLGNMLQKPWKLAVGTSGNTPRGPPQTHCGESRNPYGFSFMGPKKKNCKNSLEGGKKHSLSTSRKVL